MILYYSFRVCLKILKFFYTPYDYIMSFLIFNSNNVKFARFKNNGVPYIRVAKNGNLRLGNNFKSNNRVANNPIGRNFRCSLIVANNAELLIGENVGFSSVAIVCHSKIYIGDNVKIGGGSVIYDTDFHSLCSKDRKDPKLDSKNAVSLPIYIADDVFIGSHSTILKGVSIGSNSVVGACSVVTKDIPPGEVWAGNPAKKIKNVS